MTIIFPWRQCLPLFKKDIEDVDDRVVVLINELLELFAPDNQKYITPQNLLLDIDIHFLNHKRHPPFLKNQHKYLQRLGLS